MRLIQLFVYITLQSVARLGISSASAADDIVVTWKSVSEQLSLKPRFVVDSLRDYWTNSKALTMFVTNRKGGAILEFAMTKATELDKISAYFALRQVDRKMAQNLGFEIALSTSMTNILVFSVFDQLIRDLPNPDASDSLERAFQSGSRDPAKLEDFIRVLPISILGEWFESPTRATILPTCEALIVDRLLGEFKKKNQEPTEKMRMAIESFATIPGTPRAVFVLRGDESHRHYLESVKLSLEDTSISEYKLNGILYEKYSYIAQNVDLNTLSIGDERRARIVSGIEKARKLLPLIKR